MSALAINYTNGNYSATPRCPRCNHTSIIAIAKQVTLVQNKNGTWRVASFDHDITTMAEELSYRDCGWQGTKHDLV